MHEDILKLLLDNDADDDDDGSGQDSVVSNHSAVVVRHSDGSRCPSAMMLRRASSQAALQQQLRHRRHHYHDDKPLSTRAEVVKAVQTHLYLLKITLQRLGTGGSKGAAEYEQLTAKVWGQSGVELKLAGIKEEQSQTKTWKVEEYDGKKTDGSEGQEGGFVEPAGWGVQC